MTLHSYHSIFGLTFFVSSAWARSFLDTFFTGGRDSHFLSVFFFGLYYYKSRLKNGLMIHPPHMVLPLELNVFLSFHTFEGLQLPIDFSLRYPCLQGSTPCQFYQGLDKYSNRELKPDIEKSWPRLFIFRTKGSGQFGNRKKWNEKVTFFSELLLWHFLWRKI